MMVGRMRFRIEIEEPISLTDQDGFVTEDWIPVASVWADITPVSGKEYFESAQTLSEVTYKIYVRYITGLNSTMRINCDERIFSIQSIIQDKKNGITTIMAKEVM